MSRRLGLFVAALVALTVVSAGASVSGAAVDASAQSAAFAIQVISPGAPGAGAAVVTAPPDEATRGSFSYPADGSAVAAAAVSASASATPTGPTSSQAASDVSGLSLFGGEITAEAIAARALARATPTAAKADFGGSRVVGLQALGQVVPGVPGTTVQLADWGTLSVLVQTATRSSTSGLPGLRGALTALHVHLVLDHGGLPAGSDIFVGSAEAIVQAGTPASPKVTPPPLRREPHRTERPAEPPKPKRAPGLSLEPEPRAAPPTVHPPLTAGGYVFPVYGPVSWTDTFGAPRADVTYHHGDDIFASLGAPILAVADGTLFSVGWNDIGGLRVWLRDGAGNEFYYAHLSALSTTAVNGAVVHAGDVIGFVGNTGDARGTPYHLHFEIHPVSRLYLGYDGAVNPTRYLLAWETLRDVPITGVVGWAPPLGGSAPKAGAILLQASDISTASGLDPASLRRAFRAGASLVPGRLPAPSAPRMLIPVRPLDRG